MRQPHPRRALQLLAAMMLLIGTLAAPRPLGAQENAAANVPDEVSSIAVVGLDDATRSASMLTAVANRLGDRGYEVFFGRRLAERLTAHQAEPIPAKTSAKFRGLSAKIGEGVEKFFYKNSQAAVDTLTPVFDLGMGHPEVLARRPDFAAQIFQTGVILLRSFRGLEQGANAKATVKLLVRQLPGIEPSASTAPPTIIRYYREQKRALAETGTKLELDVISSQTCSAYVNGVPYPDEPVAVAADETYYVTVECGRQAAPVWKVRVPEGQHKTVPVGGIEPLEFSMVEDTTAQRQLAERYLHLIAYWTGVESVLGIKRPDEAKADNPVLMVGMKPGDVARWSDAASGENEEITRALARVLPDMSSSSTHGEVSAPKAGPAAGRDDMGGRWLDWTLLGVGGAGLAGGGVYLVFTERYRKQIQCDAGARSDCANMAPLGYDGDELETARHQVNANRAAYVSTLALGAGLATWGLVRRVTRKGEARRKNAALSLRFGLVPIRGGGRASLGFTW